MLIPLDLTVAGLSALALLIMFVYGAWVAQKLTLQERMPVSGHPSQAGLHWEGASLPSQGDSEALHQTSNNPEDRIWLVPGSEHVNTYRRNRAAYVRRVAAFFEEHIA
jgi:hypothetical protein